MITEKDLQEAIAECQGERDPNSRTCIKLAAFYILKDHLYPEKPEELARGYSYAAEAPDDVENIIDYYSDTEFGRLIDGRKAAEVWPLIDELVSVIQLVVPRVYDSFMQKLQ